MSALAKAYAGSQQNKRDDPDSCNSLHLGSILPSGKRLLGWSAMRLKAHLDFSSPLGIRLSNSAHPSEAGTSRREQTARGEPARFPIWRRLQCHLAARIGFGTGHPMSQQIHGDTAPLILSNGVCTIGNGLPPPIKEEPRYRKCAPGHSSRSITKPGNSAIADGLLPRINVHFNFAASPRCALPALAYANKGTCPQSPG